MQYSNKMMLFAKKLIDQSLVLEEQITPIVTAYLNNANKKETANQNNTKEIMNL